MVPIRQCDRPAHVDRRTNLGADRIRGRAERGSGGRVRRRHCDRIARGAARLGHPVDVLFPTRECNRPMVPRGSGGRAGEVRRRRNQRIKRTEVSTTLGGVALRHVGAKLKKCTGATNASASDRATFCYCAGTSFA